MECSLTTCTPSVVRGNPSMCRTGWLPAIEFTKQVSTLLSLIDPRVGASLAIISRVLSVGLRYLATSELGNIKPISEVQNAFLIIKLLI
jgi:hypothetical protein